MIEPNAAGAVLVVRAQPGSRAKGIFGVQDGALKVGVTQVAEKGKANKAIIEVLASSLGLRKSQIELESGAHSTRKRFLIRGISVAELERKVSLTVGGRKGR